jgi:hypothetical protein
MHHHFSSVMWTFFFLQDHNCVVDVQIMKWQGASFATTFFLLKFHKALIGQWKGWWRTTLARETIPWKMFIEQTSKRLCQVQIWIWIYWRWCGKRHKGSPKNNMHRVHPSPITKYLVIKVIRKWPSIQVH